MKFRSHTLPSASAFVLALLMMPPANATIITSLPGGTLEAMPIVNYFGAGPQTFGDGVTETVTWSSTNSTNQNGSAFGYDGAYGFGSNGFWDGTLGTMAGVNSTYSVYGIRDTMTFAFSNPVSAVGGFINYYNDSQNTPTIAVYDSINNLIESYNLSFSTGGGDNTGYFYGFSESTPIRYFTLTDAYVSITNLTVLTTAQIPEPASLTLFGIGMAGMAFGKRRKLV